MWPAADELLLPPPLRLGDVGGLCIEQQADYSVFDEDVFLGQYARADDGLHLLAPAGADEAGGEQQPQAEAREQSTAATAPPRRRSGSRRRAAEFLADHEPGAVRHTAGGSLRGAQLGLGTIQVLTCGLTPQPNRSGQARPALLVRRRACKVPRRDAAVRA
jgi:hypothetical protein